MKIRFLLKSFNQNLIKQALDDLAPILMAADCQVSGVVSLPTETKRFCVLRSPHIDKASREVFEVDLCKQFVDISMENPENIRLLLKSSLPPGVSYFMNILSY